MSKFIDFNVAIKYDLSSVEDSMLKSYREFRNVFTRCRNFLLLMNKGEKAKKHSIPESKKIYKIRKKYKKIVLDDSVDKIVPTGYFCYPIKGSYFQKNSFEIRYFPLLPLDKFKEAISTFPDQKSLYETYQSYPCLSNEEYNRIKKKIIKKYDNTFNNKPVYKDSELDYDNTVIRPAHCTHNINTFFVKWCFINVIKEIKKIMDKSFFLKYNSDRNSIILPIVEEMSNHLKIESNILYYIIDNYLNEIKRFLAKSSLTKRGITYKKYEKYFCEICNKFCCPFHFKIKVKSKNLDNNRIRTTIQYFKKLDTPIKYREYLHKELVESKDNKSDLISMINVIQEECPCKKQQNNDIMEFDPSLRFNKMAEINKEDFFVLCNMFNTIKKVVGACEDLYKNDEIYISYLTPCFLRVILHQKYNCSLLQYLIQLVRNKEYFDNINFFLSNEIGDEIIYEIIQEDNFLFFNISNDLAFTNKNPQKKEKNKQSNMLRTKATARLQIQSEKNLYYKPCNHYPAECTEQNCPCVKKGFCLKYCGCYKETQNTKSCVHMFSGCRHGGNSKAFCKDCICNRSNMECITSLCNCGEKCTNRNITVRKRKKLFYGYSEKIKGGGLFAGEKISVGEFIDIYDGEITEKEELDRLSVFYDQTGNNYPFSINEKFDFVTIKCGGLTRYINHGSYGEQNIEADRILVNGIPYIAFHAIRDIEKYEELLYDYSYSKESLPDWNKEYNKMMEKKKKLKIKEEELRKQYDNKHNKLYPKKKSYTSHKKKEMRKNYNDNEEEIKNKNPNLIRLQLEEEDEDEDNNNM